MEGGRGETTGDFCISTFVLVPLEQNLGAKEQRKKETINRGE